MFDDWAYREHIPETPAPPVPSHAAERKRAGSIVQRVAHTKGSLRELPEIELRKRANSIPQPAQSHIRVPPDYPWNKSQESQLSDWRKWLGSDYEYPCFDQELFDANVIDQADILQQTRLTEAFYNYLVVDSDNMLAEIHKISEQSRAIQQDVHELADTGATALANQKKLNDLYDQVDQNLKIYDALESITRTLNRPGTKIASRHAEFESMVRQIDTGLQYCQEHKEFLDMDLYEMRYRQCLARAMNTAVEYLVTKLRSLFRNIMDKEALSAAATAVMVWNKFENDGSALRPIADLLRGRKEPEFTSMFSEVEQQYYGIRTQLLASEVSKNLPPINSDVMSTFTQSLGWFYQLYDRELKTYMAVMGPPTTSFDQYLIELSEPFHDILRAYIIHESSIQSLCQIILMLQGESGEDDARWARVLDCVVKDAQDRLVFRANNIVDNISAYTATPKDFSKPVFPTVDTAADLLGQTYQLMNHRIFDDLAHRCVLKCIESLRRALEQGKEQLGHVEGDLYYIQQLVILQSRIVQFDVSNAVQYEVDFSGFLSLLNTLRSGAGVPSFQGLLQMAKTSVPQVVEHMFDAMDELYRSLQQGAAEFTAELVDKLMDPIIQYSPRTAIFDVEELKRQLTAELPRIWGLVFKYITDVKVGDALIESLQEGLVRKYADYHATIYASGSPDQVDGIMDTDGFAAWTSSIFRLRRADTNVSNNGLGTK